MPLSRISTWLPLLAGALILMIISGLRHSSGLFLAPITGEYGWGREVFSLGIALQMFLLGLLGPFVGAVADRFGSGRVLAGGALLYAIGLTLMSSATSPAGFVLSTGVIIGLGASSVSNVIVIGAVIRAIGERWRSRAVGVLMVGASLGQVLLLPMIHALISGLGWNRALLAMAVIVLIVWPLALALRKKKGQLPPESMPRKVSLALREAGRHPGYLFLAGSFSVCGFHMFFLSAHLPAYALDKGLDPVTGANALMFLGLFNMLGSTTWGYVGDHLSKKRVLGAMYLLRSLAITLFLLTPVSAFSVYGFASAMGFLWFGTIPLTAGLVGKIFGLRNLSMLYGIVFMTHQGGGFLGAWMAGWLHDSTGSYDIMWGLAIGLGILAAAVHFLLDDRPVQREPQREPHAEEPA